MLVHEINKENDIALSGLSCGLLGAKLAHSYSPMIHSFLGDYPYTFFEKNETELGEFLIRGNWTGLNVTIPYKKAVFPYMTSIGPEASQTGSINTIIYQDDGTLRGENTDVYGFMKMLQHAGIALEGKKVLVLGSGGASAAVCYALKTLDIHPLIISRRGENRYDNIDRHHDAQIIINTTPLGMYPQNGRAAIDLSLFPNCSGVFDLIYNPTQTALLLQAEQLGIPYENGLYMLVAQAKKSAEFFTGNQISDKKIDDIYHLLNLKMKNIILIGMPGCGKSTFAKKVGELTGRKVYDSDDEITRKYGASPSEIISSRGEITFRKIETEVLKDLGKLSSSIIATGGGVVTRGENYPLLHQNGIMIWLQRSLANLSRENRPLSQQRGLEELYREREKAYQRFSDLTLNLDEGASPEKLIKILQTEFI